MISANNTSSKLFELEWQLIEDKLSLGVNGIEWLVMQVVLTEERISSLIPWTMRIVRNNEVLFEEVVSDALTMSSAPFYAKYKLNWWISVDESLTYLNVLRERDYDRYFKFIMKLERKGYK
ncbi:hypothetical protein [Paenibacillus sp. FSL W8-1287]|uniref:hypothetical protein n=1 Tax=Paenibacillus sp. FSL W8-1287 TaxID=2954653 RepID=UPI0030D30345